MFTVYSKDNCPNCVKAKKFLEMKRCLYIEITLDIGQEKIPGVEYITREELLKLAPGARQMPVIFSNDRHVGGYLELISEF